MTTKTFRATKLLPRLLLQVEDPALALGNPRQLTESLDNKLEIRSPTQTRSHTIPAKVHPRKHGQETHPSVKTRKTTTLAAFVDYETRTTIPAMKTPSKILLDLPLRSPFRYHQHQLVLTFQTRMTVIRLQMKTSPLVRATLRPARALRILYVSRKEDNVHFPTGAVRYPNFPTTMNSHFRNQNLPTLGNVQYLNVFSPNRIPEIFPTAEDVPT